MLIMEGIEFEPWTSTVVIEADSEGQMVSLRGRPQEPGELRILGYSFCLAGVSSNCRFKAMTHLKVPFYSLNVVPALPCVQVSSFESPMLTSSYKCFFVASWSCDFVF